MSTFQSSFLSQRRVEVRRKSEVSLRPAMLPMELLGLCVSHTNRACCMRRRIEPTGPARTSDIDLTDHENTRRVARARSLSLGDKSLPASIREREKILSSCLRSSLLTIESPYFEQATLLLERHGVESLSSDLYGAGVPERRRRAGSRGTGRGASAWRKQQHGAAESHRHSQPVDRCPVRRGG